MPTVRVLPSGITFDADSSESILAAAWRNGVYWPTNCNGEAMCSVCVLTVVEGGDWLTPIDETEEDGLAIVLPTLPGNPSAHRLACQARANGDVVVRKIGVRKDDR